MFIQKDFTIPAPIMPLRILVLVDKSVARRLRRSPHFINEMNHLAFTFWVNGS
jgi:hypothetical protein